MNAWDTKACLSKELKQHFSFNYYRLIFTYQFYKNEKHTFIYYFICLVNQF